MANGRQHTLANCSLVHAGTSTAIHAESFHHILRGRSNVVDNTLKSLTASQELKQTVDRVKFARQHRQ